MLGLVVIGFDGTLYFATASALRERIRAVIVDADPPVTVIDMRAVSFTDTEGADMTETVTEEMGRNGILIHLTDVHSQVLDFLKEVDTDEVVGTESIHEDEFDAVKAIQERAASAEG